MEIEGEDYDTWDENGNRVQKRRYASNYWFDVDYRDPKSGESKRSRAAYMHKITGHFISCDVDIYL